MSRNKNHCEMITVDGEQVRVQVGKKSLTRKDREALAEVIRAAKRKAMEEGWVQDDD